MLLRVHPHGHPVRSMLILTDFSYRVRHFGLEPRFAQAPAGMTVFCGKKVPDRYDNLIDRIP
jgi:hypothetical protein